MRALRWQALLMTPGRRVDVGAIAHSGTANPFLPTSNPVGLLIPDHDPGIREREFDAAVPFCATAPLRALDTLR